MTFLYAISKECFDYDDMIEYYTNKDVAFNEVIKYAVRTRCVAVIYVYEFPEEPLQRLKLVEEVRLKSADDPCYYAIWLKQTELGLSNEDVYNNPKVLYDTLETIKR